MLEGAIDPKAIARLAKWRGFPAIAICDRNGLYGAPYFAGAALGEGVQPIIGALLGVAREESGAIDYLPLYAQDEDGWNNLCHLVSRAHLARPLELDPHVALEELEGRTDGLIALTGAGEGAVARLLADGKAEAARAMTERLARLFPGRLYVELARRGNPIEAAAEEGLIELAYATGLPLVATNPANFAEPHMHAAHDAMLCIANSTHIDSADRPRSNPEAWVKSAEMMEEMFADLPEAVAQHARRRAALRVRAAASQADPAQPRRRPGRRSEDAGGGCPQGPRRAAREVRRTVGRGAQGLPRPARIRDRRHRRNGLSRLLPDRCRLHQVGQGARNSGGAGARFGRGFAGRLVADHHRSRSDPPGPAVRTLPQPRARLDAGLRHRLLRNAARRGDPLRAGEIRPRPRRADHHLRQAEGARGAARLRPHPADELRPRRPAVQDGAQPSDRPVDPAARAQRCQPNSSASTTTTTRSSAWSTWRCSSKASRATPRPTPRAW